MYVVSVHVQQMQHIEEILCGGVALDEILC